MTDQAQLLREAWASTTGNPTLDRLRRQSLAASACQVPELAATLRTLELGERTQLDLHLDGPRDQASHETSASALGEFLKRAEQAVRDLAKSGSNMLRLRGQLNVLAPSAGSVRIVFVEQADDPEDLSASAERWRVGMSRLAATFESASADEDDLGAMIASFDVRARESLRLLGKTIASNQWDVAGELVDHDGAVRRTRLTVLAADRLVDVTSRMPIDERVEEIRGVLDGWRWSNETLRFIPEAGPTIDIRVGQSHRSVVADLVARRADDHHAYTARVRVTEYVVPNGRVRANYELLDLTQEPSLFDPT